MKSKILFSLICIMTAGAASAALPYRVEQVKTPAPETPSGHDPESFAREHRFYIGGAYDFSMWSDYTDKSDARVVGKNASSFDAVAGLRLYDIFRLEANYIRTNAEYDAFKLTGDTAMINAIFDARVGNLYSLFYRQHLVPYIGFGGGLSWNSADGATLSKKIAPAAAALAGLGIEFGAHFTIDVGYRYFYMFNPQITGIQDFNPAAHQFRAGIRVNF